MHFYIRRRSTITKVRLVRVRDRVNDRVMVCGAESSVLSGKFKWAGFSVQPIVYPVLRVSRHLLYFQGWTPSGHLLGQCSLDGAPDFFGRAYSATLEPFIVRGLLLRLGNVDE